jgi:serine phosphatase RsbU (regulator of sigma subunit)
LLVVDDDRVTNRILQAQLKARGYEVDSASDGEQALEQTARSQPDLLFLDVAMPGIGGLEVLERIKAQEPDLAIIMMTAYGTEEVAIEALRSGADDYLRKPFDPAEFGAVLERTVARLRLSRQNVALRRQLDEKRRQLEVELSRAARVQAELLPNTVPQLEGFDLAARFVPAREVGGDFYDWMEPEPGSVALTLGDVMGKGMPAALLMATARAVLRALIQGNLPAAAVNLAARALEADLLRAASFLTLFHARLDVIARRVSYVDAGHGHVFVRRADGTLEGPQEGGIPLGILPDEVYKEGSFVLGAGDALVVYSDGLVDAHPGSTLDAATIAGHLQGAAGASEMVDRLIELADPTDSPPDDLTAMVLYCRG